MSEYAAMANPVAWWLRVERSTSSKIDKSTIPNASTAIDSGESRRRAGARRTSAR
jgi:hypothetical protein